MFTTIRNSVAACCLLIIPASLLAQAPTLGTAANFVLFSTDGAVTNNGISHLTGKVGTNNGSSTGFGNVNGGMHDGDGTSAQAATDLLVAYNQLNSATPAFFPSPSLGGGQTLTPGVYSISGASTLNGTLNLDAQNNSNAVFIFQISGPLSTSAGAKVKLINGAKACNVFWKVEGLVDMASGTSMKGTVIANNAGINMNSGDTLEGRALSTTGALSMDGVLAYLPSGCGSPVLTGPAAPTLGEADCYGIFSADGPVQNSGVTNIKGDVGTNVGLTTGYNALLVSGKIHPTADGSTGQAAADLIVAYDYLNLLPSDIELLYPAQFGGNLVLTPHVYEMNGATTFTDSLYLNAEGNANAVFVIKIYGALSTSTFATVLLINGAQAENVYWLINGAVDINDFSVFNGTIVSQGAINLFTGATINGRALTGGGAMATNAMTGDATMDTTCQTIVGGPVSIGETTDEAASIYPNPFHHTLTIKLNQSASITEVLSIYNIMGSLVYTHPLTQQITTIDTSALPAGVYTYRISGSGGIQGGRLISQP